MAITYSTEIDAPIDIVWKWSTEPDCLKQWLVGLVSDEIVEEKPGHVGTRFKQVWSERGREMEMDGVVRVWDEHRRLGIDLTCPYFSMSLDDEFEQIDGQVIVTQTSNVRYKGCMVIMGLFMGVFMKKQMKAQVAEQFALLKKFCEAEARGDVLPSPENADDEPEHSDESEIV